MATILIPHENAPSAGGGSPPPAASRMVNGVKTYGAADAEVLLFDMGP